MRLGNRRFTARTGLYVLGLALGTILTSLHPPSAWAQPNPFAAVDACMQQELSQKNLPGGSMAIAVDGELAHTSAFGVRRLGTERYVDTETIFRINSTTKMMGAAAVMQLIEQGRLDLNAPITDYVPDLRFAEPWQASSLTLHTLLANAGGMPDPYLDYSLMPLRHEIPAWDIDLSGWASRLGTMHLYAPPGSFWSYSSPNFSVAGLALERVTGQRWEAYVVEQLFRPAGMRVASFDPEAVVASGNYANGHYSGRVYEPADFQRPYAAPGGGAFATPTELVTWTLQLMGPGGSILSPDSLAAMTHRHYEAESVPWSPRSSYGYGIFIDDYRRIGAPAERIEVLRHPGNGRGQGTELVWVPELGFALATLINGHANMLGTVDCALRELAGLEPAPQSEPARPETWGRYAGTYAIQDVYGARWTAQIELAGRQLRIHHADWHLLPGIREAIPEPAPMNRLFFDTFRYQYAGDQTITFQPGGDDPAHTGWLANRYFVGQRLGRLPSHVDLEGDACRTVEIEAGLDAQSPTIRAYGLAEVQSWEDQPVAQEDPDDPSGSAFKVDLEPDGDLGYLAAWLFEASDDNLELYLMQDQDGDGDFAWPDELVQRLTAPTSGGLFLSSRSTPGDYQIWVHGQQVTGAGSIFRLDLAAISGAELELRDLPERMDAGRASSFELCARPEAGHEGPRVGLVEIDFGAPGAIGRVPVYWSSAEIEESVGSTIHLPWLARHSVR